MTYEAVKMTQFSPTKSRSMSTAHLRKFIAGSSQLLLLVGLLACQNDGKPGVEEKTNDSESKPANWSYDDATGPVKWADLDIHYSPCADGKFQSPINIVPAEMKGNHRLNLAYHVSAENILFNGHTVELVYDQGSKCQFDNQDYDLLQFHFHTPAEHAVEGIVPPLEMHLVHRSSDTTYLVVSVLFQEGEHSDFLKKIVQVVPDMVSEKPTTHTERINIGSLFPPDPHFYFYQGSFTTPPCTEGVRWVLLQKPLTASAEQITALKAIEGENARPLQNLNNRQVETF